MFGPRFRTGGPARRLLLLLAGLAIAARMALIATVPPAAASTGIAPGGTPLAMLQAAMILCDGATPPADHAPVPIHPPADETWLSDQSAPDAVLLVAAIILPPAPLAPRSGMARPPRARAPPPPYRATAFARGPPISL